VEFMGGADAVVAKARASYDAGDLRWVAEVLNHVVFAHSGHEVACEMLADTYEQLGYGAENGTWRSAYLSGAYELRHGSVGTPAVAASPDLLAQLTPAQLLDSLAIRIDGPRCWHDQVTVDLRLSEPDASYRLTLRHGTLTYTAAPQSRPADAAVMLPTAALPTLASGGASAEALAAAGVTIDGDAGALDRLLSALDAPDPDFAIVTP